MLSFECHRRNSYAPRLIRSRGSGGEPGLEDRLTTSIVCVVWLPLIPPAHQNTKEPLKPPICTYLIQYLYCAQRRLSAPRGHRPTTHR